MKHLLLILGFVLIILNSSSFGQNNYKGINIQGQFNTIFEDKDTIDLVFEIIDFSNNQVWKEIHKNVYLSHYNSFSIILGKGEFLSGNQTLFENIDWETIERVNIYQNNSTTDILLGSYSLKTVPYSFHSLHSNESLSLNNLTNTPNNQAVLDNVIKYNGNEFYYTNDLVMIDSVLYSYYSDSVSFVDTVQNSISSIYADSSNFSFYTDTSLFSNYTDSSIYSYQCQNSSISNVTLNALNNWSLQGNTTDTAMFLGSTLNDSLIFKANNQILLNFSNSNVTNTINNNGFSFNTNNGFLFNSVSTVNSLSAINFSHFYFNPKHFSTHIGNSINGLDTLSGDYSFSFGYNVGTNGSFSTVFGYNTYGDSTYNGSTGYNSISSFGLGKNCHVSRISVAIGDNAIANYYRNVAIGKNVTANTNSASVAIGNNVSSTGATSWAIGKNLTANGHFSTALGSYASTNLYTGSFVYGDASSNSIISNTQANQFMVRADSGFIFYTSPDLTMGVSLIHGDGSWNMISDKNKKHHIVKINGNNLIESINNLPIYSWYYNKQDIQHIGPMAQDFNTLFKVGEMPDYINMIDIDGITFSGIKTLNGQMKTQLKTEKVNAIKTAIEQERLALEKLELQIKELYEKLDH
jgi:hypothetical protein